MTAPLPNPRYERKFVPQNVTVPEVLACIRRHPAGFRETYPTRTINNLYLDSPGLRDYHDHVNGAANRTKTRVRWYGAPGCHIQKPVLERKIKKGLISGKIGETLPGFSLNGQGTSVVIQDLLCGSKLSDLMRVPAQQLTPTLFNRYERRYFVSADGHYRLTVDSELQFGLPRTQSVAGNLPPLPTVVLELKFAADFMDGASLVTNALPFRLVRFSKYVLGIQQIR